MPLHFEIKKKVYVFLKYNFCKKSASRTLLHTLAFHAQCNLLKKGKCFKQRFIF